MTDEKLLSKLKAYYDEAFIKSKTRRTKWKNNDKSWKNKKSPPNAMFFTAQVRANYPRLVTDVKMPIMVGNKPTITYISRNKTGEGEKNAETMSKIVGRYLWDYNEVQNVLKETLYDAMVLDIGYMKTYYDASKNKPFGETIITSADPFKMMVDPYAIDIDDARYVVYVDKQPITTLSRRFPGLKKKIMASEDNDTKELIFEERKWDNDDSDESVKVDRAEVKEYYIAGAEFEAKEAASIVKRYIAKHKKNDFDILLAEIELTPSMIEKYDMTEEEVFDYMRDTLTERVLNGGVYITTINDKIVAELKPNPYKHGKSPYVSFISNMVPHSHYGRSDLEDVIPLANTLNESLSQLHDAAIKTSSPTWRCDPLVGKENLRKIKNQLNRPGTVILIKPGMLEPNIPPNIPAYAVRRIPENVNMIERVSGITDVLQGRGDIRQRTALGVQVLTQAGTSRISTSIAYMEMGLKRIAYKTASIVQQFWTEERTVAIAGDRNYGSEVLTIGPDDLVGEMEVSVDSGASLPQDKMSRVETVLSLHKQGVIQDALLHLGSEQAIRKKAAEFVMNEIEMPHREELLKERPEAIGTPPAQLPAAGPAQVPPSGQPVAQLPDETAAIMAAMEQQGITPEEVQGMAQAAQAI